MRPVDQRIISPENGDCLKSCVASLLELQYEEVPNFIESGRNWYSELWKFMNNNGYCLEGMTHRPDDNPSILDYGGVDGFIIARGESLRFKGSTHAVIYKDGKLAHDPHPSRDGIPKVIGFYKISKQQEPQ